MLDHLCGVKRRKYEMVERGTFCFTVKNTSRCSNCLDDKVFNQFLRNYNLTFCLKRRPIFLMNFKLT